MYNANRPTESELPTTKQLLKSTGIALAVATGLLVTVVLPAEYGVDPTRIGSVLGLTEMGRIKQQLAREADADAALDAAAAEQTTVIAGADSQSEEPTVAGEVRSDETVFELAPDQGLEIKLAMNEGARTRFTWRSSGGAINFDVHGDRPGLDYYGYGRGSSQSETGDLTAAFTGGHGWFWRNRSGETVTITLTTEGEYSEIRRIG
jgi:hypothetical protein